MTLGRLFVTKPCFTPFLDKPNLHRKNLWDGEREETRKRGIERHDWHVFIFLITKCVVCFGTSE